MKNEMPIIKGFIRSGMNNYEIVGAIHYMGGSVDWNGINGYRLALIVLDRISDGCTAKQALASIGVKIPRTRKPPIANMKKPS